MTVLTLLTKTVLMATVTLKSKKTEKIALKTKLANQDIALMVFAME